MDQVPAAAQSQANPMMPALAKRQVKRPVQEPARAPEQDQPAAILQVIGKKEGALAPFVSVCKQAIHD